MGKDLFEFLRCYNFHVIMVCKSEVSVEQLKISFDKSQKRALKYHLIDQDQHEFRLQQTTITTDLNQLINCNLIIEAVTENLKLKKALFKQLELVIPKDCIITSNTSSISPDRLFKKMLFPERYIGLHFFFPVQMKDFVEINVSKNTSDETLERVKDFLIEIGKFHLELHERDHFLINRIFLKMQTGCCRILEEGKHDVNEIDDVIKAGLFPIGVFEFFDHVGLDIMLQSVKNYMQYESDPLSYQPLIEALEAKVKAGKLGKKTASGFYEYPRKENVSDAEWEVNNDHLLQQITHWYLEGVFKAVSNSACTKAEIAHVIKSYMMVEKNPFDLAQEVGYTPK